jgi:hypothetical protein
MASMPLPLSIIADVTIITASPQVAAPTFNSACIIGPSTAIPSYGVNPRIRKYLSSTYSTAMVADGFSTTSPEYICAQIYFSQSPPPQSVYIGRQDLTAIETASPTAGNAGINYKVGDIISVVQTGASNGQLSVTAINVSTGAVATLATIVGEQGTGYSVATGLSTTGGSGTGLEVNVNTIGETALQASMVCRSAQPKWYPFMVTDAAPTDHIAISAWALSQQGTVYFGTDSETNVLNGVANNTFQQIYNASSKRTWMQWASTQSGLYPNQIYFVAAVMGQAMASNTQLANSAFTEKFSGGVPLLGVVTEASLSVTQIANIEGSTPGQGPNGNLFLNYANAYNVLEQGTMMASGVFFDQVLNLDILGANIQYSVMNAITSLPKIPQTDPGQQVLIQAVENALNTSATTGFIGPGIWQGQTLNVGSQTLSPGQSLPNGYLVLSPSYAKWGPANPSLLAARQAPPIYVALIEAGAVHFITVEVLVQI